MIDDQPDFSFSCNRCGYLIFVTKNTFNEKGYLPDCPMCNQGWLDNWTYDGSRDRVDFGIEYTDDELYGGLED